MAEDRNNSPAMTKNILIVLHSDVSSPGRIGHMLVEKGYRLDLRRPCLGEALPASMEHHAGAVIFGGPMSANDPDDWIAREIDWIGLPLKEEKPFLGVCLGAQMLSKQLGGRVGPHADGLVEIGYYPLRPTDEGKAFGPWPEHVYHWHREGLTLPHGATRMATGETFENQAFRYGPKAFGIQFSSRGDPPSHASLGCAGSAPLQHAGRSKFKGPSGRQSRP